MAEDLANAARFCFEPLLAAAAPDAAPALSPVLILILAVAAGIGTFMLLPSKREATIRKLGGVVLLAAGLILAASLIHYVAGLNQHQMSLYFWIFSAIAILSAVRVVTHPRPVYSALYFVLTVLASAGLFVLLWAEFMAIALIMIYAGAILVTYVFVIMLASQASNPATGAERAMNANPLAECDQISREPLVASAIGFTMMGVLLFVIFDRATGGPMDLAARPATQPTTQPIAAAPGTIQQPEIQLTEVRTTVSVPDSGTVMGMPATIITTQPARVSTQAPFTPGSPQAIGTYLFRNQLVNLELAGLILTIAMVGAILIARRQVVLPAGALAAAEAKLTGGDLVNDNPHSIPIYGTHDPQAKAYPES